MESKGNNNEHGAMLKKLSMINRGPYARKENSNAIDPYLAALSKLNRIPYERETAQRSVLQRNLRKTNERDGFSSLLNAISTTNKIPRKDPNDYSQLLNAISSVNTKPSDNFPHLVQTFHLLFSPHRVTKSSSKFSNAPIITPINDASPLPQTSYFSKSNALINIFKTPVATHHRATFECLTCFEEFHVDEGRISCSSVVNGIEGNEKHAICVACIRRYAKSSRFDSPVAPGGVGLKCAGKHGCDNVLLLSEFEMYLSDEDYGPLKDRLQQQCILDASIPDLVMCPECAYKGFVDLADPYFTCNCGRIQCRSCPRLYDAQHHNKTCKEMDEIEARQATQRQIDLQASEIIARQCQKCKVFYVKTHGCNKMQCICGATQCFVCREPDITYHHFCNCNGRRPQEGLNGPCPQCGKTCTNSERADLRDERRINELQRNRR